jgi:hypothetical protein
MTMITSFGTIATMLLVSTLSMSYAQSELGMPPMESAEPATENSLSNQGLKPAPDTSLSNSGIPQQEQEEDELTVAVIDAVPNNNYRICGGTIGETPVNFGCEITLKGSVLNGDGSGRQAYTWPLEELKQLKNTMLYACVMGEEEKKVSCNVTGIPQTVGAEITIDWSESSRMQVPATFSTMEEQPDQIMKRMASQDQTQADRDNSNNDEEEGDEND